MPVTVSPSGVVTCSTLGNDGSPSIVLQCQLKLASDGALLHRPWSSLALVPNRTGTVVFSQDQSNKLLISTVPSAASPGSPVLCFGALSSAVSCCVASDSGALLASGTVQGQVAVWQVYDGSQVAQVEEGHIGPVTALAFLGPAHLASGGRDGLVHVWEWGVAASGQGPLRACEVVQTGPHPAAITAIASSLPDGSLFASPSSALGPARLAVARADGMAAVYRVDTVPWDPLRPRLTEEARLVLPEGKVPVTLDMSPDGVWLAVGCEAADPREASADPYRSGCVLLYRTDSWKCTGEAPLEAPCVRVKFLPYVSADRQGSFFVATRDGGMQVRSAPDASGSTLSARLHRLHVAGPVTSGPLPAHEALGPTRTPAILEEADLEALERIEQSTLQPPPEDEDQPEPRGILRVQPALPSPRKGPAFPLQGQGEDLAPLRPSAAPPSPNARRPLQMDPHEAPSSAPPHLDQWSPEPVDEGEAEREEAERMAGKGGVGRGPLAGVRPRMQGLRPEGMDPHSAAYSSRHARCLEPYRRHIPFPSKEPIDLDEVAQASRAAHDQIEARAAEVAEGFALTAAPLAQAAPLATSRLAHRIERVRAQPFQERPESELRRDPSARPVVREAALAAASVPTAFKGLVPVEEAGTVVQPRKVSKQVDPRWKQQQEQPLPAVSDFLVSAKRQYSAETSKLNTEVFRVPFAPDRSKILKAILMG